MTFAKTAGYPVIIKAAAGGGGKGMRVAFSEDELVKIIPIAQVEAGASFDNPDVYVEKYLLNPRHIEIQFIADRYGNAVHLEKGLFNPEEAPETYRGVSKPEPFL